MFTQKQIDEAIEYLRGSCKSEMELEDNLELYGILDYMPFLDQLDNAIFNCVVCGWWFEQGEQGESETGEWTCEDCCGH